MFGYVLYPDGGCRGQHEYSGAGIHGYRWNLALTPKGIGHTTHAATLEGYEFKADTFDFESKEKRAEILTFNREQLLAWASIQTDQIKTPRTEKEKEAKEPTYLSNFATRVTVERYFDAALPLEYGGTNNTAELKATINSLEQIIAEPDFEQAACLIIRQDSMYVVEGFTGFLPRWLENNFKRRDGSEIGNPDLWRRLSAISQTIQDKGVKVIFKWVKAHNTCIGNNSADTLATMATLTSKDPVATAKLDTSFRISDPSGYWASKAEQRHPMMCQRYCYYDIAKGTRAVQEYYLSTQGKAEEMVGKRTSDDGFSVIRCGKQPLIEQVSDKQLSIPREIDYMFNIDLDSVYGADSRYMGIYGTDFLHRAGRATRHLETYGEVLMTKELHPPFLTERVFDNVTILSDFLDNYQKTDQPTLFTTDITECFYTTTEEIVKGKKGEEARTKCVTTLKVEFVVGTYKHVVEATYKPTPETTEKCDITLRLGIDLPDRNALRKLEESNPKVYLVTNTMGPGSFMYAVVIEAGEDVGIWSGINSSIRVIAKKPNKATKETKPAK